MKNIKIIAILFAALCATACKQKSDAESEIRTEKEPAAKTRPTRSPTLFGETEEGSAVFYRQAVQPLERYTIIETSDLDATDTSKTDDKNIEIFRSMYWAGAVRDNVLLAQDFLKEAKGVTDGFKLADLAKSNVSRLTAEYERAQKNRLFALHITSGDGLITLRQYDAAAKGFPIGCGLAKGAVFGWYKPDGEVKNGQARWTVMPLSAMCQQAGKNFLKPKSDDDARSLEALVSARTKDSYGVPFGSYYLGHIAAAGKGSDYGNNYMSLLVIDGLVLEDVQTHKIIGTFDLNTVDKSFSMSDFSTKFIVFPEKFKSK